MYENFSKSILDYMQTQCKAPQAWGWFHLVSLAVVILLTFIFVKYFGNAKDKQFRLITFICWVIILTLEIYKQITMNFTLETPHVFSYQWYIFPFQFCSTPLYVLPFIAFLKDSKVRDTLIGYMAFYSLFAGLCVFFFPDSVYCNYLGINIQTMVHHGTQVVLGIYMGVYFKNRICLKNFIYSMLAFIGFLSVAVVLNTIMTKYKAGVLFNMFFVNPKFSVGMPILQDIQNNAPYIVFFISYMLGFSLCAFIMYLIMCLIDHKKPFRWNYK